MTEYLESTDLVELSRNDEHGRVVIAKENISIGQKVIRESPVIVWKQNNWVDFFRQYSTLPGSDQVGLLGMHSLPLDCPQLNEEKVRIIQSASIAGIETSLALKLASICVANCHEYHGNAEQMYREVVSFIPQRLGSGKTALFLYASKVRSFICAA